MKTFQPAARLTLGRMTPLERATGRFMRGPDEHPSIPPVVVEPVIEPVVEPTVAPPVATPPVDDEKARLLKDVMKNKAARVAAETAAAAAAANLAAFDGITPAEVAQFRADKAASDLAAAEARGDYDRIVASMREQTEAREAAAAATSAERDAKLKTAEDRINELTVGRAFGDSKFLSTSTILSPTKARKLYSDHFEFEDGEFVAYDKPEGAKNRTRLVNARGDDLSFDEAIEKIVKADPDYESVARSTLLSGASTAPLSTTREDTKPSSGSGKTRIAAALAAQKAAK